MRTLDDAEVCLLARLHDEARKTADQIDPVSVQHPNMTIDDGYAIQSAWLEIEMNRGAQLIGLSLIHI